MASPSSDRQTSDAGRRSEYLWCGTTIAASLACWFSAYLLHGYTFLSEAGQMLWTEWVLARHTSAFGGAQWNAYSMFGVDWVGREAFLNPSNLGTLAGRLLPGDKASFMITTLVFLAAMGVSSYALLRALDIRPAYARIGMIVYLLAPKWLDDGYHGPKFIVGYALLPVVLTLILRMAETGFGRLRHFVVFAALVAMIYLGLGALFLIVQAYFVGAFFAYAVYRTWKSGRWPSRALASRVAIGLLVAVPLIVGLSAFVLWPFWRTYGLSERSLYGEPVGWGLSEYLGLVFPWINRLFAAGVYDLPYPAVVPLLAPNVYFFVGILAVPVLAIGFARKLWTPITGFFATAFVVWLAIWSKPALAVFPLLPLAERLAHGSSTQDQGHIILILSMSVILAAGLQAIDDRREEIGTGRAGRWLTLLNAALIAGYLVAAAGIAAGSVVFGTSLRDNFWSRMTVGHYLFAHYYFQECAALFIAIFLTRALAVWLYHRRYFTRAWGATALLILLAADFQMVFRTVYPFTDMDARYDVTRAPNRFVVEHTGALDRIGASQFQLDGASKAEALSALVAMPAPRDYREVVRRFDAIYDEGFKKPLYEPGLSYFPMIAGRSLYGFHESLMPSYFWDFDQALNSADPRYSRSSWLGLWDPHSPLLDVAGIKYVFWHEPVDDPRLVEVGRYGVSSRIYENRRAVPRAYVVPRVEYFGARADAIRRMQAPTFQPLEAAVTEDTELSRLIEGTPVSASNARGLATLVDYTPDRIVVDVNVESPRREALVLNDMYYPGWSAQVEGVSAAIYRVNATFRAVVVPPGRSRVELRYANPAFRQGAMISGASWIAVGLILAGTSGFTRRRAATAAPLAAA